MLPLAITWALGAMIAVLVGDEFTEQAFDSALLDDAYAVSANVRQKANGLDLGLTEDALGAVLFDQSETMYFAVLREDDSVLAGQAGLRAAGVPAGSRRTRSRTSRWTAKAAGGAARAPQRARLQRRHRADHVEPQQAAAAPRRLRDHAELLLLLFVAGGCAARFATTWRRWRRCNARWSNATRAT